MRRSGTVKAWLVLIAVFLIGGLAGVGGTLYYVDQQREARRAEMRGRMERERQMDPLDRFLERVGKRLDLTEEQRASMRADQALQTAFEEIESLNRELRPRFKEAFERREEAFRSHLTPEQIERLNRLKRRWSGRHGGRD